MLDHSPKFVLMATAANLVQNDTGDAHARIERLVTQDQRCNATRHAPGIDDQDNGQAQQRRQCGVAVGAIECQTVIQALIAFDDADVGLRRQAGVAGLYLCSRAQVGIEVKAGATTRPAEPHGVDVVWPFLESLNHLSTTDQCRAQPDADRGLARGFMCSRYEQAGHAVLVSQCPT